MATCGRWSRIDLKLAKTVLHHSRLCSCNAQENLTNGALRLLAPALSSTLTSGHVRHYYPRTPKRKLADENYQGYNQHPPEGDLTKENETFVYKWGQLRHATGPSPLKEAPWPRGEWTPYCRRTGLVAIKLGMQPLWTKEGKRVATTLLQVLECNVLDFIPKGLGGNEKHATMLVAAKNASPYYRDQEWSDLFKNAHIPVKEHITRFNVSEHAALQPGTPLYASHFRPGMYVDIAGRTIDKGFQGVMKRWGMKGQPASHGVTKTHRKMGASGGGGDPGRIWPGKKMPGLMGNRIKWTIGLKVLRVNTKHNILYLNGHIHGRIFGFVKVKDSVIYPHKEAPPFPTATIDEDLEEDLFDDNIHRFGDPSIEYEIDEEAMA